MARRADVGLPVPALLRSAQPGRAQRRRRRRAGCRSYEGATGRCGLGRCPRSPPGPPRLPWAWARRGGMGWQQINPCSQLRRRRRRLQRRRRQQASRRASTVNSTSAAAAQYGSGHAAAVGWQSARSQLLYMQSINGWGQGWLGRRGRRKAGPGRGRGEQQYIHKYFIWWGSNLRHLGTCWGSNPSDLDPGPAVTGPRGPGPRPGRLTTARPDEESMKLRIRRR
jgi:hypothetical protein